MVNRVGEQDLTDKNLSGPIPAVLEVSSVQGIETDDFKCHLTNH